jgi:hypothetical protein
MAEFVVAAGTPAIKMRCMGCSASAVKAGCIRSRLPVEKRRNPFLRELKLDGLTQV